MPKSSRVRPTTDKIRSAVFSIIGDDINGAKTLDAFAGSGALGIEAISRGADFVLFTDTDTLCVKMNASMLEKERYRIKKCNFLNLTDDAAPFDIIFIDPPYSLISTEIILKSAVNNHLLAETGIIVYEEFYKTDFICIPELNISDERRYGDTIIRLLRRNI